jgi:predicted small lipoprotein YifL
MKKLVLFVAVLVAVSFASCGNKAEAPAEEVATEEVVAAEEAPAADTAAVVEEAAPVAE